MIAILPTCTRQCRRRCRTAVTPNTNGKWEYKVGPVIGGANVEEGDYILISYYVRYEEGLDPNSEKLRNQIGMEIEGIGPYPIGIESSYYSLDKRCLSKADDAAKAAAAWHGSPLSWETVIGSIKNASSEGASTGDAVIPAGSTFADVLACDEPPVYHYFTQSDIDGIKLVDGNGVTVDNTDGSKYTVTPMAGTKYDDLDYCEANQGDPFKFSRKCNAFRIEFLADIAAPVTVKYTSYGYAEGLEQSTVYTNTSYFTPEQAGSTMSDTATLAYNDLDYLQKFPAGDVDMKNGLAKWYFLLNPKNNLEFGFNNNQKYQIKEILPDDTEFCGAFAVPYRNGGIPLSEYTPGNGDWEQYRVPEGKIQQTTEPEGENGKPAVLIDVTEYLSKKQNGEYNGCLANFQPGDTIAIYVVTKIKKDLLFANGPHTLSNAAYFVADGVSMNYTGAAQDFNSEALDKTFKEDEQDTRLLTYTVTVNEQGTSLKDYLGKDEVTLEDMTEPETETDEEGNIYETKEFHYTLTESGKVAGVTNDPNAKHLTVTATYDRNSGELTLALTDAADLVFINTCTETYYASGSFRMNGTKTLTGSRAEAMKDGEFSFVVKEGGATVATGRSLAENVSANIVELSLNGRDTANDTVSVTVEGDNPVTLYVTETDADGNPVAGSASFKYDVAVEGSAVTMSQDDEQTVVITNRERETTESEESESETKIENPESESESETVISQKSVKTGDETPLGLYIGLMAAAALLLLLLFVMRRRRRG